MMNKLNFIATVLYSPATRDYYSPQQSPPTTEYQPYPTQSPSPPPQQSPTVRKAHKVPQPTMRKPRGTGIMPIFLLIFIIILLAAAWFLPWWQYSNEIDDTDYKTVTEYDLEGMHSYQELTDEQTESACPYCGEELSEYDLANPDYYCPECDEELYSEYYLCPD